MRSATVVVQRRCRLCEHGVFNHACSVVLFCALQKARYYSTYELPDLSLERQAKLQALLHADARANGACCSTQQCSSSNKTTNGASGHTHNGTAAHNNAHQHDHQHQRETASNSNGSHSSGQNGDANGHAHASTSNAV